MANFEQLEEVMEMEAQFGGQMRRLEYLGFGGCRSHCYLEVLLTPNRALVVFTEDPKQEGTSITNLIEDLASIVRAAHDLDPAKMVVIEHWTYSDGSAENWSRVHFKWSGPDAQKATWEYIKFEELDALAAEIRAGK